jgi:hypothetical protein
MLTEFAVESCHFHSWGVVRPSPLVTPAASVLILSALDDGLVWSFGAMRSDMGSRIITLRRPAPVPPYPPQILHDLTWVGTWAAAVRSRLLTAKLR